MNAPVDEPVIPPRLHRPLAALWISLGLHLALIALVQVVPSASLSPTGPTIEARLVSSPGAPQAPPPAPEPAPDEAPRLRPAETADALPVAAPAPSADPTPTPTVAAQPSAPTAAPPSAVPSATPPASSPAAPAAAVPVAPAVPAPLGTIASAVDLTYYSARELDVQPRALREIVPDYPEGAERERVSGTVRLQLKLEADGRVSDINILSAAPPGVFDESAIRAFRHARFAPARRGERPVRALLQIEVIYDWEGRP